jgi:hypothetical protein
MRSVVSEEIFSVRPLLAVCSSFCSVDTEENITTGDCRKCCDGSVVPVLEEKETDGFVHDFVVCDEAELKRRKIVVVANDLKSILLLVDIEKD